VPHRNARHSLSSCGTRRRDPAAEGSCNWNCRKQGLSVDSRLSWRVGNTKNPGQSFEALYADVVQRVFATHDDATWFYPGHGDDSTIGAERPHLDEWRDRGW